MSLKNPNMRIVRKCVKTMGGTIEKTEYGGKHVLVSLKNCDGQVKLLTISHYRTDPYILQGWVRQALTRESRNAQLASSR